jgi:hypothetical protein
VAENCTPSLAHGNNSFRVWNRKYSIDRFSIDLKGQAYSDYFFEMKPTGRFFQICYLRRRRSVGMKTSPNDFRQYWAVSSFQSGKDARLFLSKLSSILHHDQENKLNNRDVPHRKCRKNQCRTWLRISRTIPNITNIHFDLLVRSCTIFFCCTYGLHTMHIPSAKSVSFDVGANTTHKYNSDAPPGSENGRIRRRCQHHRTFKRESAPNDF